MSASHLNPDIEAFTGYVGFVLTSGKVSISESGAYTSRHVTSAAAISLPELL
jgi:hypothetical protein